MTDTRTALPHEVQGTAQHDADAPPTNEQATALAAVAPEDTHTAVDGGPTIGTTPEGEDGPTQGKATIKSFARGLLTKIEEEARGFSGFNPDPNPNEAYTVAGQLRLRQQEQAQAADPDLSHSMAAGGPFQGAQSEHPYSAGPTEASAR